LDLRFGQGGAENAVTLGRKSKCNFAAQARAGPGNGYGSAQLCDGRWHSFHNRIEAVPGEKAALCMASNSRYPLGDNVSDGGPVVLTRRSCAQWPSRLLQSSCAKFVGNVAIVIA